MHTGKPTWKMWDGWMDVMKEKSVDRKRLGGLYSTRTKGPDGHKTRH